MGSENYAVGDVVEYGPPNNRSKTTWIKIGTKGVVTKVRKNGITVQWEGSATTSLHDFGHSATRVLIVANSEEFVEDLV